MGIDGALLGAPPVLPVAVVDTDAALLRLMLGPSPWPAVASTTVALPGRAWSLRLEVLAASHRVVLEGPGADVPIETVACLDAHAAGDITPVDPAQLPVAHNWAVATADGLARCSFRSSFTADVVGVADRLRSSRTALVVAFPGHPDALTALCVRTDEGGAEWTTWHLYPAPVAVAVRTTTRLRLPRGRA